MQAVDIAGFFSFGFESWVVGLAATEVLDFDRFEVFEFLLRLVNRWFIL